MDGLFAPWCNWIRNARWNLRIRWLRKQSIEGYPEEAVETKEVGMWKRRWSVENGKSDGTPLRFDRLGGWTAGPGRNGELKHSAQREKAEGARPRNDPGERNQWDFRIAGAVPWKAF
eukprot:9500924-Pyramimonas_sp.AAC.1